MDVLAQTPQTESKDIKLSKGKITDSKSDEGKDFFESIIANIISESEESEHKSFLLSKLLNLSSEFEIKEQTLSEFSDEALFNDHQIGQVSIQDLLKIAIKLKNGEDPATFPTDSQTLKLALLKPEVTEQFKSAKNIKELLDIAKKNNIEVKNFQFFSEAAALDPKDKKIVQKIKSEDIFKLIEKQVDTKAKLNITTINNPKETLQNGEAKTTILQTILASKEIIKPFQNEVKNLKEKPLVNFNKSDIKAVISEVKVVTPETKEIRTEVKVVIPEAKEIKSEVKSTKIVIEESKEIKKQELNTDSDNKKVVELKTTEFPKQKIVKNNFASTISLEKNNNSKDIQNSPVKTETLSEKIEVESSSSDKTVVTTETKTNNVDKTRNTSDLKRTFSTFAEEFKEKVENYKPPLMKIKMELKPAGLGDVDVTLLSRGNNLQVNINSNSSTIAMFMQNQTEFKNSLINMGFSDLQMNFSEQQKKEQDGKNQKNSKNGFEQFEENEEQDGFEIIIPRYV